MQVTEALDVSYPAYTVAKVGWRCVVETADHQNTEAKMYESVHS